MIVRYLPNTELYHHGIKGQRWGVRRYQNADGSLTQRGKSHYSEENSNKSFKQSEKELLKNKKAIRIAAAIAGALVIARVTTQVVYANKAKKLLDQATNATKFNAGMFFSPFEPDTFAFDTFIPK